MIRNYMEIIVEDTLPSVMKMSDLKCDCQQCKEDVMAIALNNLEPMYIASEKGIVYSKLNQFSGQFNADVVRELTFAIDKVKANPRH